MRILQQKDTHQHESCQTNEDPMVIDLKLSSIESSDAEDVILYISIAGAFTTTYDLNLTRFSKLTLSTFCDANWDFNPDHRNFTTNLTTTLIRTGLSSIKISSKKMVLPLSFPHSVLVDLKANIDICKLELTKLSHT
ncbi:hypothetical protein CR513_60518, partial [Mucuna pruriens]